MNISIVDDELLFRQYLKNFINWKDFGFDVIWEAKNGEEALEKVREKVPDIMLVDINMPFMNGLDLSRQMKLEFPETHIVLVTGQGEFEYARKAIRLGVKDYILKPFTKEELIETINNIKNDIEKNEENFLFKNINGNYNEHKFYPSKFYEDILIDLRLQNAEDLNKKLNNVFKDIRNKKIRGDFLYGISYTLISVCLSYVSECGKEVEEIFHEGFNPFKTLRNTRTLEDLINYIQDVFDKSIESIKGKRLTKKDKLVDKAKKYIDNNFSDEDLCLEKICKHVYVNESYLRSIFKQNLGVTITEYITTLRMEKARELIKKGGIKFSDIGESVGYSDAAYFTKCFKKKFGITPTEYEVSLK